ncbi:GntR family transcriptional regulator [Rhodococcus olei]
MGRNRTEDLPDLSALLAPQNELMVAVEQSVLRNRGSAVVAASLAEQIAAKLAGVITLGVVDTGQRLLEQDISAVLQVSRAPVREALRILERDRLVHFQSRRGAVVTPLRASDVRDLFDVRSTLYEMLLRHEMTEQYADLKAVFDSNMPRVLRSAGESPDAYAVATFVLNSAVAQVSSNRILAELLQSVSLQALRYVRVGLAANATEVPRYAERWRGLHGAILAHDTERAVDFAGQRISSIRDAALRALGESPEEDVEAHAV